jgi:hypothetical protein
MLAGREAGKLESSNGVGVVSLLACERGSVPAEVRFVQAYTRTQLWSLHTSDADAFCLDDQQVAGQILLSERGDPSERETGFHPRWRMAGESGHNYPVMGSEREAQKICKPFIG